jgi:hypothetical protein
MTHHVTLTVSLLAGGLSVNMFSAQADPGSPVLRDNTGEGGPAVASVRAHSATNAAPATPKVIEAVFVVPTTVQEGRDPFFPDSTRLRPAAPARVTSAPPVIADLELKGISDGANLRLAIINNRTFGTGEEGDVICAAGRVRIKCMEIMTDSVRVFVNGSERVLQMRAQF